MIIAIIVILLLGFCCCCISLLGGGGAYYYSGNDGSPPETQGTPETKSNDKTDKGPIEGDIGVSCKTGDICNDGAECKFGFCFEKCVDKGDCKADLVPRKDKFYCDYSDCKEEPKEEPMPFNVGDKVLFNWRVKATATDLCAPSPDDLSAYGEVKTVDEDDKNVHVQWNLIKNPSPRSKLTPAECCWVRSSTDNDWNLKYWGDETKNPTYNSGLKSIFTFDDAKTALKKESSQPVCPPKPAPTCNKDVCNATMKDWIVNKYWRFDPGDLCPAPCPQRGFKAPYMGYKDGSWTNCGSKEGCYTFLEL